MHSESAENPKMASPGRLRTPSEWTLWDIPWVTLWWLIGAWVIGPWMGAVLGLWAAWGVVWQPKQARKAA